MTQDAHPQFVIDFEQRWRDRQGFVVRPKDELFQPAGWSVDRIGRNRARDFCYQHHYSGSISSCIMAVGLFQGTLLSGVAVFGNPSNERTIPKLTSFGPRQGLELSRLVLLETALFNAETWFLSRAFSLVRQNKGPRRSLVNDIWTDIPGVRAIVSYSDPIRRRTQDGRLIMPGHVGTIYQGLNARFAGRGTARWKIMMPDGTLIEQRSLNKFKNGERSSHYVEPTLVEHGAPPRQAGEDIRSWIARIEAANRRFYHPGNFRYVWGLDPEARREVDRLNPPQKYPKRELICDAKIAA